MNRRKIEKSEEIKKREDRLFTVACILLFVLGITILITAKRLDFGLIVIILLFTVLPVAYFIMLFINKKKNVDKPD